MKCSRKVVAAPPEGKADPLGPARGRPPPSGDGVYRSVDGGIREPAEVGDGLVEQARLLNCRRPTEVAVKGKRQALAGDALDRGEGLPVVDGEEARRYLQRVNMLSVVLMGASSIWAASSFLITAEASRALVIIFIFLAASACASSLASLPSAAILSLIVGLAPTSLAMFISGDVRLIALATNVIAVSIFQSRLIVGQFREMVRNLELQTDLEVLANTDPLTGLHNRRAFSKMLADRVACCGTKEFAIAMLDLDGFKPVNDRFGHAAGDEVLTVLANRLRAACRSGDHVARIGGDEFAIVFAHDRSSVAIEEGISAIGSALAEPYLIDGHHVFVSASIGTACFPAAANTVNGLLSAADEALYIVKAGRNTTQSEAPTAAERQSDRKAA